MSKEQNADKIVNIEHAATVIINGANVSLPGQQSALPDRKHFITDVPKQRYILDDYSDDEEVEFAPDVLFYRSLFFITLHTDQDKYLLLDAIPENEITWSVPYTCIQIDSQEKQLQTVEDIEAAIFLEKNGYDILQETLEKDLFHRLGIRDVRLDTGRKYFEYIPKSKKSEKTVCTYICEYFVHEINPLYIKNLSDPGCILRHHYLPFSVADRLPKAGDNFSYLEKSLQFCVSDVLMNHREKLSDNSIRVAKKNMVYQKDGILFRLSVTTLMDIQLISSILNAVMAYCNISSFWIEGNAVIGIMPHSERGFSDLLQRLDAGLSHLPDNILICCTAHSGIFEYGKTLDLSSQSPSFAGHAYTELLRLDLETDLIRRLMSPNSTGILFGWDTEDYLKIRPLDYHGRIEYPDKYPTEGNRTMKFIHIMKKVPRHE